MEAEQTGSVECKEGFLHELVLDWVGLIDLGDDLFFVLLYCAKEVQLVSKGHKNKAGKDN